MKAIGFTFFCLSAFAGQAHACSCYSYPFEPNPPCYNACAEDIVENGGKNIDKIQNLPTNVRDDLRILVDKKSNHLNIDFDKIQGPKSLSEAAKINDFRSSPTLNNRIQLKNNLQFERSRTLSAPSR